MTNEHRRIAYYERRRRYIGKLSFWAGFWAVQSIRSRSQVFELWMYQRRLSPLNETYEQLESEHGTRLLET